MEGKINLNTKYGREQAKKEIDILIKENDELPLLF